jgi:soluble lytic murein transglycosylase-like protein
MTRRLFASLSCLAIGVLSCGHFSLPLSNELPPVSLASAEPSVEEDTADPMVERAIRYLEGRRSGLSEAEIAQVATAIVREARIQGIDPNLVMAVIMQIMPPTGEELAEKLDIPWRGAQTLFDPLVNVRMGIAYLKQLEGRYANTATALAAYNWGPGRIDSKIRRGVALPVSYSGSVLATYRAP